MGEKIGVASIRALQFLNAKEERHPNASYGWHMPGQRTARACRQTLEPKGLVVIARLSPSHFRYRITEAGRLALQATHPAKENEGHG